MIPFGALDDELEFSFVRSSGPGGQHVNKVSTKVRLRFSVTNSKILEDEQKTRLLTKLKSKLTTDSELIVDYDASRSQTRNKKEVTKVFYTLLNRALTKSKPRRPSTPSAAAVAERRKLKQKNAEKKTFRKKPDLP
jgi:ribosome-associated protein